MAMESLEALVRCLALKFYSIGFVVFRSAADAQRLFEKSLVIDGRKVDPVVALPRGKAHTAGLDRASGREINSILYYAELSRANRIYVGSLTAEIDEDHMRRVFGPYGGIKDVQIVVDHNTGKQRGFCFVTFETEAEADAAVKDKEHIFFNGSMLDVRIAEPKRPGPKLEPSKKEKNRDERKKSSRRSRSPSVQRSRGRDRSRSRDRHRSHSKERGRRSRSREKDRSKRSRERDIIHKRSVERDPRERRSKERESRDKDRDRRSRERDYERNVRDEKRTGRALDGQQQSLPANTIEALTSLLQHPALAGLLPPQQPMYAYPPYAPQGYPPAGYPPPATYPYWQLPHQP